MRFALIVVFIFLALGKVKSLLVKPQEFCVPTLVVKGPCHECICNSDGVFICHAIPCPKTQATNQHIDHDNLPEIENGQSCVAGMVYKMSCNTCQCGQDNALLCTKMACFENAMLPQLRQAKKVDNKEKDKKGIKQVRKDILRQGLHNSEKEFVNRNYTKLLTEKCTPGTTFKKGCKKCFCNERKVFKCTRSCSSGLLNRFSETEFSEMETRSVLDLPELPHMGAKCDPGRTYYVVCNICFCSHKKDLFCSSKYCINLKSFADAHAKELTGHRCKKDFRLLCSECKCVNKRNQCRPISNCGKDVTGKQLLSAPVGTNIKLSLDINKEKCEPQVSYKFHCNDCFCQPDRNLRCTQKVCLTYSQSKELQQKQTYLEKHGL